MLDKEPLIQSTQSNTTLKLPLRAVSFLQRVKQLRRLKNRSVYRRISSIRLAFSADFCSGRLITTIRLSIVCVAIINPASGL